MFLAIKLEQAFLAEHEEALMAAGYYGRDDGRYSGKRGNNNWRRGKGNYREDTGRNWNDNHSEPKPKVCIKCGSAQEARSTRNTRCSNNIVYSLEKLKAAIAVLNTTELLLKIKTIWTS